FDLCFFFQAEDGIRDWSVTGVQTCALPIWTSRKREAPRRRRGRRHARGAARLREVRDSKMGRGCESIRRQGGLTRTCSFAVAVTCGGNATAQRRVFKCERDLPSAEGRKSPRDDQWRPELTGRSCVSTSSPPRAACSARRSQDCANVSQKGLSRSSAAAFAMRKQSCALLR